MRPGGEFGGSLYVERELRFVEHYHPTRDFDYEKMTVTKRLTLREYAWLREKYFFHPTLAWRLQQEGPRIWMARQMQGGTKSAKGGENPKIREEDATAWEVGAVEAPAELN